MAEKNTKNSHEMDFGSENIFSDFRDSEKISKEVKRTEEKLSRDMFFYLKYLNSAFFIGNIVLFCLIFIIIGYLFIQNSDAKKEYGIFAPICHIFLWSKDIAPNTCYGVKALNSELKSKLNALEKRQAQAIIPIMSERYAIENFSFSKKMTFIIEKSRSRLKPKELIAHFDELKLKYAPIDKSEVSCRDIQISGNNFMKITCEAYSSDWDSRIIKMEKWNINYMEWGGTSISRASSFIDFLERHPDSRFMVIDRPKFFTIQEVQEEGPYTQKTSFTITLEYSDLFSDID